MRHSATVILLLLALVFAPAVNMAQEPAGDDPAPATDPAVEQAQPAAEPEEAEAVPEPPPAPLPQPSEIELLDVPNDGGTALGMLWRWAGSAEGTSVTIEARVTQEMLERIALSAAEQSRLDAARDNLRSELEPVISALSDAEAAADASAAALTLAVNNKTPDVLDKLKLDWAAKSEVSKLSRLLDKARNRFVSASGDLEIREMRYRFFEAQLAVGEWAATNISVFDQATGNFAGAGSGFPTKDSKPDYFGHNPQEPDKLFAQIEELQFANPAIAAGTVVTGRNQYGVEDQKLVNLPFYSGVMYDLRMRLSNGTSEQLVDLGSAETKRNYFNKAYTNNLVFSFLFATIILASILIARRNPNLFIRRIQGLEAVDEAIGRATEMGKPVLYLCGLDPLSTLSTLAAVNILGRVARRIADYDSDLVVPCRDPVVLTVAQEVVKEAYVEQGRPDAYREDKIYFVTDDQFSFTASVCAIMMREKPAANFFMGYYYAESLLLAETGASTGAIQIAGTDATHQLPFFITTCDYTLIGEELYAASAYMSREPMLLGSLKGQDVGKAFIMILIILQTLLFMFNDEWNWLRLLVEPL